MLQLLQYRRAMHSGRLESVKCEIAVWANVMEFIQNYDSGSERDDDGAENSEQQCTSGFVDEGLSSKAVRQVYLITYSQAELQKFPTRLSFARATLYSFSETPATVRYWSCSRERHQNSGFHYHMAIKLDRNQRWIMCKRSLERRHDILVHFSNVHHNYFSTWGGGGGGGGRGFVSTVLSKIVATYLPPYLPTYLTTYLPTYLPYQLTNHSTYLLTHPPTFLHPPFPTRSPTYLLFIPCVRLVMCAGYVMVKSFMSSLCHLNFSILSSLHFFTQCMTIGITKTSGKLGQNQYRKGTWDRFEGQDKQKCRITQMAAACVARYTGILLSRHLSLSSLESCLSKRSQAPLRYWFGPSLPLVLVMAVQVDYFLTLSRLCFIRCGWM